jgi:hypothetical protein
MLTKRRRQLQLCQQKQPNFSSNFKSIFFGFCGYCGQSRHGYGEFLFLPLSQPFVFMSTQTQTITILIDIPTTSIPNIMVVNMKKFP